MRRCSYILPMIVYGMHTDDDIPLDPAESSNARWWVVWNISTALVSTDSKPRLEASEKVKGERRTQESHGEYYYSRSNNAKWVQ
jgi:hypothetical protein